MAVVAVNGLVELEELVGGEVGGVEAGEAGGDAGGDAAEETGEFVCGTNAGLFEEGRPVVNGFLNCLLYTSPSPRD